HPARERNLPTVRAAPATSQCMADFTAMLRSMRARRMWSSIAECWLPRSSRRNRSVRGECSVLGMRSSIAAPGSERRGRLFHGRVDRDGGRHEHMGSDGGALGGGRGGGHQRGGQEGESHGGSRGRREAWMQEKEREGR